MPSRLRLTFLRCTKRRGPATRSRAFAAAALAVCLASGCEVRDEIAVNGGRPTMQQLLSEASIALADGDRIGPQRAIEFVENLDAALQRSHVESKPVLVVCQATWCRWCAEMSRGVLGDPRVIESSSRLICVRLDADRDAEACRRLGVDAFPTVMLLESDGRERHRLTGRSEVLRLAAVLGETVDRVAAGTDGPAVVR
jgi:thiol:disulfide interchange protein